MPLDVASYGTVRESRHRRGKENERPRAVRSDSRAKSKNDLKAWREKNVQ